ncbi:MAG: hypothetical protein LAN62_19095, partial [Acidobacteriia bacterium]|nr:hypothetical protein [Terriglobia bacterium]
AGLVLDMCAAPGGKTIRAPEGPAGENRKAARARLRAKSGLTQPCCAPDAQRRRSETCGGDVPHCRLAWVALPLAVSACPVQDKSTPGIGLLPRMAAGATRDVVYKI